MNSFANLWIDMAKLEQLAVELESIHDRHDELLPVVAHARDDSFPRDSLLQELLDARLGFFAHKLATHYYEDNAAEYEKSQNQKTVDNAAKTIAKEALAQSEAQPVPAVTAAEKKEEVAPVPEETAPSAETIPEPAPVEPTPAETTPETTPAQPQVTLPHCPSCAGFHLSNTEEHPYQIPDQKM